MRQSEAFTPPKPWTPDRFRSVITSLADHTIIDQEAIPWCTNHDNPSTDTECWWGGVGQKVCIISTGGPAHKWWRDGPA